MVASMTKEFRLASGRRAPQRLGLAPALALFLTAPLVAEFLLGNLPITLLPALVLLAPLYGGGALLVRETVRRTGRGWPSILCLGLAYALLEEGFATESLFNPDYLSLHLGLLKAAYLPALGIGGWWTLWMLNVHAVWSIATPIALIEACVPRRRSSPWLGNGGYAATACVFAIGLVAMGAMSYQKDHFVASAAQFCTTAGVILLLIATAFRLPSIGRASNARLAPSPWLVGAAAAAAGSAALLIPKEWGWPAMASLVGLDVLMILMVVAWSRTRWTAQQTLALASGAAVAYAWHAFVEVPVVGNAGPVVRIGNAIFALAALGLIALAARRTSDPALEPVNPLVPTPH